MAIDLKGERDSLVSELRIGNEQAFERLFRLFYPTLRFFANRIAPMQSMAEEIVQDCLFKVWQKREEFDSYASLKAFLYISTKNACLDSIDKENRKNNRDHSYYLAQPEYEQKIEEEIIYSEVLLEISQAMNLLPEQCRKIMKMLYEDGKKAKGIAEELGISVSTVNNQKARGISLLKSKISKDSFSVLLFLFYVDIFN